MEMKRFLGNIARVFLATGALSVSTCVGADENTAGCTTAAACNTCCGQPTCEPPVCGWAYNPPAYCRCNNPANSCDACWSDGLTAHVDFLWWRAYEENTALGVEETYSSAVNNGFTGTAARSTVFDTEHVKQLNFKYDPGFRLGLYEACSAGCWDLALDWTHYHTKATANGASNPTATEGAETGTDPVTVFVPFWDRVDHFGDGSDSAYPDASEGRYTLNMDLIDLSFGRKFYVSSCFVLRPHFGLRGARIDQNYRIESVRDVVGTEVDGESYATEAKLRNDFLAIGPRLGLDAQIHLGCGLSIFGQAAGSLVFGRFDRHSKEVYDDFAVGVGASVDHIYYETENSLERTSRAFTDLTIGFKWERCFEWCNHYHPVTVAFAWEHHAFFNMNNFNMISSAANVSADDGLTYFNQDTARSNWGGDLYTQGLTVSAAVGF